MAARMRSTSTKLINTTASHGIFFPFMSTSNDVGNMSRIGLCTSTISARSGAGSSLRLYGGSTHISCSYGVY
ncbi:hypothetical protein LPJ66_008556, partial [Kickxella alabastrina]